MKCTRSSICSLSVTFAFLLPGATATVGQASLLLPSDGSTCGPAIHDSDFSVAISSDLFAGGSRCGDEVTVQFGGRSVNVKVASECVCIDSSIEMTQAAYTALMAPVIRPVTVNWAFD
ncbi:hypothetical protein B0H17DRAFT_1104814 [Mycena rosella]|uniref:Uncharacterized protein n=1 Tax=Mycena rosella TaxID=1033263 RepID=A0AAD7C9R6_MYCRO|nr:hypothetical protein B0H17DRAFT_1104814 [Mycena rosella]